MKQNINVGDSVGGYLLVEELGSGAAATVYSGQHLESGVVRAIKILGEGALQDEELQRRFMREMSSMKRVDHENVVQIEAGGLHGDSFYYVMEVVDSGTLSDVLPGPLPWRDVADSASQLCDALHAVHLAGIVHRDLKPDNIYLSSDGMLKIGDFGLVRDLEAERLTTEGMTVGSVLYMSPEQIRGDDELSGAADMYSLGCVLFEMLTGRTPFVGDKALQVWDDHLSAKRPCVRDFVPDCPEDLAALVKRLLSIDSVVRPDAGACSAALAAIADGNAVDVSQLTCSFDTTLVPGMSEELASVGEAELQGAATEPESSEDSVAPNLTERLHSNKAALERPPINWVPLVVIGVIVVVAFAVAQLAF